MTVSKEATDCDSRCQHTLDTHDEGSIVTNVLLARVNVLCFSQ